MIRYTWTEPKANAKVDQQWWRIDRGLFKVYRTEAFLDSLMRELSESRQRLSRLQLRRVHWSRRLLARWESFGGLDRHIARKFRPLVAAALRAERKRKQQTRNNESNHDNRPGGRPVWFRWLSPIH